MSENRSLSERLGPPIVQWHRKLQDDRGARAGLRRAGTLAEITGRAGTGRTSPARFYDLERRLSAAGAGPSPHQTAAVAGLLAFLDPQEPAGHHSAEPLGRFLAGGGGRPGLTELRFRRLLAVPDGDREELFARLGRVVRAYRREPGLHPLDVALTAYLWGPPTREALARGYYTAVLKLQTPDEEEPAPTTPAA